MPTRALRIPRRLPRRLPRHIPWRDPRRLLAVLGPDPAVAVQSLVALALNSATSLLAGAVLGSITGTFERLPGLLLLVPAAIGLRGNVFSTLGNRLSTSIHTGTFRMTLRPGSVLGDNVIAALSLTVGLSLALAAVAKGAAVAFGVPDTISVVDLATISIVGGVLASAAVLAATVALAGGAVRYGWDLDNLVAPVVSTLGDVLTLPALFAATYLVGHGLLSASLGTVLVAATVAVAAYGVATGRARLRRITRESWPILLTAVVLSTMAGLVIEKQLATFATYPALLVLFPAFVSSAGAIGGILTSRVSTQLHLGVLDPTAVPQPQARQEALTVGVLAVPVYVLNAAGAHLVASVLSQSSPGLATMVVVALLGAAGAVAFVLLVAYYGSVVAVRLHVDPDTYGIPVVTSSVDFAGTLALILAIAAVGVV